MTTPFLTPRLSTRSAVRVEFAELIDTDMTPSTKSKTDLTDNKHKTMTLGRMLGKKGVSPRTTPHSTPVAKKKKFGFLASSTDSETDKSWSPELDKAEKKRRKKLLKKGVTGLDIKLAHSSGSQHKVEMIKSVKDMVDEEGEGGEQEIVRVRGMSVRRLDSRRSPRSRRRVRSEVVRKSIKSDWDCPAEWNIDPNQIAESSPPPLPPKNIPLRHPESPYVPPLPPKSVNQQGLNREKTLRGLKSTWEAPDEWNMSPEEWDSSPSPEDWDRPLPPLQPARPDQKPSLPPKGRNQLPPALPPKNGAILPPKQHVLTAHLPQKNTRPPGLPPKLSTYNSGRPPALPPKSKVTDV